jgi:aspartate/methionine/tyrosine aminotransferase
LAPFAPLGAELPKVDSFKLDIETIEKAVSDETSAVSTANPDEDTPASELPQML